MFIHFILLRRVYNKMGNILRQRPNHGFYSNIPSTASRSASQGKVPTPRQDVFFVQPQPAQAKANSKNKKSSKKKSSSPRTSDIPSFEERTPDPYFQAQWGIHYDEPQKPKSKSRRVAEFGVDSGSFRSSTRASQKGGVNFSEHYNPFG